MGTSKVRIMLAGAAAAAALALAGGVIGAPSGQAQSQPTGTTNARTDTGIVIHLTRFESNIQAARMALTLANDLQAGGTKTTLFLDLEGVRLADRRQPLDNVQWTTPQLTAQARSEIQPVGGTPNTASSSGSAQTLADLFDRFTAAGGRVQVCAQCASAAGVTSDDLRRNARMATGTDLATLFSGATRVVDY